jgi:hypothetical protein
MVVRRSWISMHQGAPEDCGLEDNEMLLDLQPEPRYSQSICLNLFDNTSQSFLVRHNDCYPELPPQPSSTTC